MILLSHERLKAEGTKDHFATLILAPSAVIDVRYADYMNYFKGALKCRIFYGQPDQDNEERASCHVGGTVEDLDEEFGKLDPAKPDTSRTLFLSSYTAFSGRCVRATDTKKSAGHIKINPMLAMSDAQMKERKFTLLLKNHSIIGRTIADEAHLIKNPMTLAADTVLKVRAKRFIAVTANPMLNRATDLRGYLFQLHKGKDIGLNLPKSTAKLISIFDEDFNPLVD
ncbi:dead-like helicase protein [Rutstroemia sp. NJR-2017a WRK4]|nr:dead-like helicase protein [Rutstroemia sp. NJR-2017a WRK4]